MAKPPYHTARQEHLAEILDFLSEGRFYVAGLDHQRILYWEWDYDIENRRAIWKIKFRHQDPWETYDTRAAEDLVMEICEDEGIVWLPVPHPGGEKERRAVLDLLDTAQLADQMWERDPWSRDLDVCIMQDIVSVRFEKMLERRNKTKRVMRKIHK